jgi:hypothetical protein
MAADGCVRCHSANSPTRPLRPKATVAICINLHNCRRRQKALYRMRRRTMRKA